MIDKTKRNLDKMKKFKLSDVRSVIDKSRYKKSFAKGMFWFCFDLVLYLLSMWLVFAAQSIWLKLLGGFLGGLVVSMMFVWAHDAAHGTLFKSKKLAEWLGTICMLPSLNMYRMWSFGHNRVHHGFTSFKGMDYVWIPLTPSEYYAKKWHQRLFYRITRFPLTCAVHYLVDIWLNGMIRYNPGKDKTEKAYYRNNKLLTLVFFVAFASIAYIFAGGILGIITAVIIPFIIFNYVIALFVYLHHTHPEIAFFDERSEWNHAIGGLYCSTIVRCSRIGEMFTHNIMIHVPHHVDLRVPFYQLKNAYADLKKHYGEYIFEYNFKWTTVFKIFSQCKLYDFNAKKWYNFSEGKKQLSAA
jgi:acyl-lipid omega-6 desaturase (Delta-12 desaturase)